MTIGPVNITGIPLDETPPGQVGSAEAKKYLTKQANDPNEEYITPADVGHAFDV